VIVPLILYFGVVSQADSDTAITAKDNKLFFMILEFVIKINKYKDRDKNNKTMLRASSCHVNV